MRPSLNDSVFDEGFKIITSNKSKANMLRQSLLKNNKDDSDLNMQIIQYLGEFEYDLKTLFDILRDLKLSFHEIHNTLINSDLNNKNNSNINEENKNETKKEFNGLKNNNKKERLYLKNDYENFKKKCHTIRRTYAMTSQLDDNSTNTNTNSPNISEYYIKSYTRNNRNNRTLPRSMSCKSYIGNWNSNSNGFDSLYNDNNILNSNQKDNEYRSYIGNNQFVNNDLANDHRQFFDNNFLDRSSSKDKTLKLNFDYDDYLTDYSLNKTNKKDLNNSNNDNVNNSNQNLNMSDLKNDNNINNINKRKYIPYINDNNNNNIDINLNKGNIISNKNENDKDNVNDNKNNNLFTFSEQRNSPNNPNIKDYIIAYDQKKMPIIDNNNNKNNNLNIKENNENEDYNNINNINNKINNLNNLNNKNNYNDNMNNKYNNNINNNYNEKDKLYPNQKYNNDYYNNNNNNNNNNNINPNYTVNPNIDKGQNYKDITTKNKLLIPDVNENQNQNYINYLNDNNNKNHNDNYTGQDKTGNNYEEQEDGDDLEDQKKEIIKQILSEIFQDTNKLDVLKAELGEDIGEELLNGNISEEKLYKVVEVLKNYQLNKTGMKKNNRHFPTKKFNQPIDKILLKESLDDKRYNYREYPRGWASTKDYFVNNGSTFIKSNRRKKY